MPHKSSPTRSEESVQRVYVAAAEVFAEDGFAGARMDEIARRAGMNKAMLYYHVGDKSALYNMVLLETIRKNKEVLLNAVAEEASCEGKLRAAITTLTKICIDSPHFPSLVMREIASGGQNFSEPVLQAIAGFFNIIRAILTEGESQGCFRPANPLLTHMQIMGSIFFLTKARPIGEKIGKITGIALTEGNALSTEEISRHIAQMFLYGMKTGKGGAAIEGEGGKK